MIDATFAIEFNNLGVVLLNEGNRRAAVDLFKGASQLMIHVISQLHETDNESHPLVRRAHMIYKKRTGGVELVDAMSDHSSMKNLSENLDDSPAGSSKLFICERAILLTKEHLPSTSTQLGTTCCSVLLYNLSLVYHLAAVDSVLESSGQKALNLYTMAFSLLLEENFKADSTLILRVMMYCLNNMAALSYELTQWELSAEYMKRLTIVVALVKARDVDSSLHEECQSFLLNAMVLKTPTRAPTA